MQRLRQALGSQCHQRPKGTACEQVPLGAVAGEDRKPSFGDEMGTGGRGQLPPSCVRGGRTVDLTREHPRVRGRGGVGGVLPAEGSRVSRGSRAGLSLGAPDSSLSPCCGHCSLFPRFQNCSAKAGGERSRSSGRRPVAKPFLTQRAVRVAGTSGGLCASHRRNRFGRGLPF